MLTASYSAQFRRDYSKIESRGKDISKLDNAIAMLVLEQPLPLSYKDHQLKGKWIEYRELHVESDWLLIYKIIGDTIIFARTGSHSDLF